MSSEPAVGATLAASAAQVLEAANIACLLWGWQAISFFHKGPKLPEIILRYASECEIDALNNNKAELAKYRNHPVGAVHFHPTPDAVITLLRQSEILPWLPEIKLGPPAANDDDLTTSHDPMLPARMDDGPSGPWSQLYPIQILNPNSVHAVRDLASMS
ncbi:hypothetical protein BJX76DRAFT_186511 [Aspergillus varians]